MTAAVDIPNLIKTLHHIAHTAPHAHSLTYDRPARYLDPDRHYTTTPTTIHHTNRPPAGNWTPDGTITAINDQHAAQRWHQTIRQLKGAHHDLTTTLTKLRGPQPLDPTTNPLNHPLTHITPRHIHHTCHQLATLLQPLTTWQHIPPPLNNELPRIAEAITLADEQFPDHIINPTPPARCRNIRDNDRCVGTPKHHARQLCAACLKLEDDLAAERTRRQQRRWCPNHPNRRVHARGVCMTCYQRHRRNHPEEATA